MLNLMKYIGAALFLMLNLHGNLVLAEELKTKTIISNGIGKDVQSAAQNAAQNALTNVVGTFVDATTVLEKRKEIKNGISEETKKIKTDIKEYSQGSIRSFEIIDKSNEDGFVKITAKVVVNIEDFRVYIKKIASDEKEIDQGLFAVIEIEQKQQQNISQILNDITRPMYTGEILEFTLGEIKSIKNMTYDNNSHEALSYFAKYKGDPSAVYLNVKIKINKDFKNKFINTIDNISIKKKEISFAEELWTNGETDHKDYYDSLLYLRNNPDISGILIKLENRIYLSYIPYRYERNISKKYIGCPGKYELNEYVRTKKINLEFLDGEDRLLQKSEFKDDYKSEGNKIFKSLSNQQYGINSWMPVNCYYSGIPIFNLDDFDLDLFFIVTEKMKNAKKIRVRLAD